MYANADARNAEFKPNVISNTKYTWYNFVPKNLWEQFARNTNRYFLLIAVLQLYREITPVNPLTTWAPLAVIFMITAVKEGLDDWGRRAQDAIANARLYTSLRDGRRLQVGRRRRRRRRPRARARARARADGGPPCPRGRAACGRRATAAARARACGRRMLGDARPAADPIGGDPRGRRAVPGGGRRDSVRLVHALVVRRVGELFHPGVCAREP